MSKTSIIICLILTLSAGYFFVYPSFQDLSQILDQKQQHLGFLKTINGIESKKTELLTQFEKISATDKKNIDSVLPNSFNFVKLISQIDAVAANYGISIGEIASKETDPSIGDSVASAQPPRPYQSAIISFSFVTSYDNFRAFLDDLEKSLRILDVKSVNLQTQEDGLYLYKVEFETYWLK